MPQLFSSFRLNVSTSRLLSTIHFMLHGTYNIFTILEIHFLQIIGVCGD